MAPYIALIISYAGLIAIFWGLRDKEKRRNEQDKNNRP